MKFILENIWLICLLLISGGALLFPVLIRGGAKASIMQATQIMNQSRCTILDVRDVAEFGTGHIRNAKNIPLSDLPKRLKELERQKANPVLVVCAKGVRSAKATAILTSAGFSKAVSMEGGFAAWQEQGLPVVK